ncbi:MAG: glutathione peroxidase [Gemmataceae bacterium]
MRHALASIALITTAVVAAPLTAGDKGGTKVAPVLNFKMKSIDGKEVDLSRYQGKVVLLVNVASECGYTPQYKQLQALHEKYAEKGLAVLGFPCNDFGGQEPGSEADIKAFCKKNYGVTFDMFAKVNITKDPAPLYKYLTSKATNPKLGGMVKWNFEKFLIGRDGSLVARYASDADLDGAPFLRTLEAELAKR